jgi:hypothetical protein
VWFVWEQEIEFLSKEEGFSFTEDGPSADALGLDVHEEVSGVTLLRQPEDKVTVNREKCSAIYDMGGPIQTARSFASPSRCWWLAFGIETWGARVRVRVRARVS